APPISPLFPYTTLFRSTFGSMPTTRPRAQAQGANMTVVDVNDRAQVLVEALPYIKRFHGQVVVIKVGGNAIERRKEETLLDLVRSEEHTSELQSPDHLV